VGEAVNPWLHILAATIWVGPQFMLFIAAVPAIRSVEDAQARARAMRILTTRLVLTGIGNLYENDLDVDVLFDRNFGVIFQVKMTLLIIVVVLTALHSFVIGPRLSRLQESAASEAEVASARRLSMMISGVALLVSLAILFCGALLASDYALEG
jgi:putative copper export protein